jgi:hypothetical protein
MSDLRCPTCNLPRDISDNFCRNCGRQITIDVPSLPAIRAPDLPVPIRSVPPSLIGSVAVLALGTGLEWAARRLGSGAAKGAARAAGRALLNRGGATPRAPQAETTAFVEELIYIRQVQVRR